jgi:hypothetical protein
LVTVENIELIHSRQLFYQRAIAHMESNVNESWEFARAAVAKPVQ